MRPNPLRFLADESCSPSVILALRQDGHDVYALSEVTRRTVELHDAALKGAFTVIQPGLVRFSRR